MASSLSSREKSDMMYDQKLILAAVERGTSPDVPVPGSMLDFVSILTRAAFQAGMRYEVAYPRPFADLGENDPEDEFVEAPW